MCSATFFALSNSVLIRFILIIIKILIENNSFSNFFINFAV
nr:MAG TPA: hypothetical protein [Caudoviricetes sp.]